MESSGEQATGGPAGAHADHPIAAAETAADRASSEREPLGLPGRPVDRRSPFVSGLLVATAVAVVAGLVKVVLVSADVLVLIAVALFIAVGLEPVVVRLARRLPRAAAVAVVVVGALTVMGTVATAIAVPLAEQAISLAGRLPQLFARLRDHNSFLGALNDRFHLDRQLRSFSDGPGAADRMLDAGITVLGALGNVVVVVVLTIYFLADLPRIRAALFRFAPRSRRPRVILIGDEIFAKVGAYLLGSAIIAAIAGTAAFAWLTAFGVPYALLLALLVALLDLVPVVGSLVGALAATLAAGAVSLPVCLVTAGFFVLYRLIEDYVLLPKIIGKALRIPALVTVVAVLLGATLLGVAGALMAIPAAAAVLLVVREVLFRRLDRA